MLPGSYWPAGEDYWTGPALGGRGRGTAGLVADQAAGLAVDRAAGPAVDRDEPVYDYEDGQP
ncbi:MAG TPA: hypothetical protein VGM79_08040 [Streptosporangiaceae bacterium]